ncbi:thioredoxin family protein [Pelagicoccus sp. SDUM812003]|uniref:thioredoxin family protein n=1 Tax=Pelagicoccus sp. SDUM812003 TaxID=3041267 RepID=UPI00280C3F7E|nr:thioredoxin family protein [Pelagicoccus sp. SDUM812003]MDQ8202079.1 thioredoxin family protein [Pelagicoccus sp. SDUM812003]
MTDTKKKPWIKYLVLAALVLAAYFINVEVQTRLGQKAVAETGLPRHSFQEALAKAEAENKPVLANLSAIWCPTCRSLDKTIFVDETVRQRIADSYVYTRIDFESEEGQAFKERYGVNSFPTLLVLNPQGDALKQLPITTDPSLFAAQL